MTLGRAGQERGDCSEPRGVGPGRLSGGGADHGEPGSSLRKLAKNAVGSRPVGQDHKEAFVLGGVQGVDGQNGRGGGSTPWGGTRESTHCPLLSASPCLSPATAGSPLRVQTPGKTPGTRLPYFSAPHLPRLVGGDLSQIYPSEPQKILGTLGGIRDRGGEGAL